MGRNDVLWKGLLEDVFDDLLRFLYPGADAIFDIERGFEFLDKELIEMYPEPAKDIDTRFVDKLVKVYKKNGREEWLLCHIEVQGYPEKLFPERMFKYYYRIFDRFNRPVTAVAIFTGANGKTMPNQYSHNFLGTHLVYQYNTLCMMDYTEEFLLDSENPFSLVALAAQKALSAGKIPEEMLLQDKLMVARILLERKEIPRRKVEGILSFLNNLIPLNKPETIRIFEEQLDLITCKSNTMGVIEQLAEIKAEEGREQGRAEGEEKKTLFIVENLLKGTEFSVDKIASLAGVTATFVEKVKNTLLAR